MRGVSREGRFGNQPNALGFAGAPFEVDEDAVPLYGLVDRYIYGLSVLGAVKQERYAPTRVSFVYSQRENRVYYALERDFARIKIRQF